MTGSIAGSAAQEKALRIPARHITYTSDKQPQEDPVLFPLYLHDTFHLFESVLKY